MDVLLHEELLRSPYRTHDPEQADFFFIPLYLSLGFYSHRYYFKHFTRPAERPTVDALRYVRETWPYFKRRNGADHLLVMTQDQGNRFARNAVRNAARPTDVMGDVIMLHHWGAPTSVLVDKGPQGDHRVGHDICVPPFHGQQVHMNRWLPNQIKGVCPRGGCPSVEPDLTAAALRTAPAESDFLRLLFFSGKMNFNWGRHYSLGARQAVFRAHRHDARAKLMTFDTGVLEKLPFEEHVRNYATSKFCLAPAGYGFSSRQYECVLVGCVPVIIQDDVEMAFEEVLPWHRFSLRLNFSDIPDIPEILARIPAAHVGRLRRGLGCVWPRMLWLGRHAPGLYDRQVEQDPTLRAAADHDAFETVMMTLRRRLKLPERHHWRARTKSCAEVEGDDGTLDLDAIRREVRGLVASGALKRSTEAQQMADIIADWQRTADDAVFAMKTRYFPTGVKPPGFTGKWLP